MKDELSELLDDEPLDDNVTDKLVEKVYHQELIANELSQTQKIFKKKPSYAKKWWKQVTTKKKKPPISLSTSTRSTS